MKLALIPPLAHVTEFCEDRDYHLVLPHLLQNEDYAEFYSEVFGHVILDNGMAEGVAFDWHNLMSAAEMLGADEIVIPDHLGDGEATIERTKAFHNIAKQHPEFKYIGVVQGRDSHEIVKCLTYMALQDWISVVALPRCLNVLGGKMRITILSHFADTITEGFEAVHCLGMSKYMDEPLDLAECDLVRGMDTSLPFTMAIAERLIKSGPYIGRTETYFDHVFTSIEASYAHANVLELDDRSMAS